MSRFIGDYDDAVGIKFGNEKSEDITDENELELVDSKQIEVEPKPKQSIKEIRSKYRKSIDLSYGRKLFAPVVSKALEIKKDKRGYRYCRDETGRVKCPPLEGTKPTKEPKAKKEPAPKIKKEKLTIDQAEAKIQELRNKGKVEPDDVTTMGVTLMGLTVKDLDSLKKKLKLDVKSNLLKPEKVKKIVDEALKQVGVENTGPESKPPENTTVKKPPARKPPVKKPVVKKPPLKYTDNFSEAEFRARPSLAVLGDKLKIKDIDDSSVQRHLDQLSRLPEPLMKKMLEKGLKGVIVGVGSVPEHEGLQHLKGKTPRGWPPEKTWDTIAGTVVDKQVVAGTGESGSASTALHEFGHAIGDILYFDNGYGLHQHHLRLYDKLQPYLQQGGRDGIAGRQELLAEGVAQTLMDEGKARGLYDDEFVDWIKNTVLASQ